LGNEVSPYFDSMLGKIISFSSDRATAIQKLIQGLERLVLFGPSTNRSYLIQLLRDERVQVGEIYTQLLSEIPYRFDAASALKLLNSPQTMNLDSADLQDSEEDLFSPWGAVVQKKAEAFFEDWGDRRFYFTPFADWSERREHRRSGKSAGGESDPGESLIRTPMPGKIVQVAVQDGATVQKGQLLLILEAMKMEHQIRAGMNARVKRMAVQTAQQVLPDDLLVELEPLKDEA
jgi:geranyl-CoA carboxylase alpha subunit